MVKESNLEKGISAIIPTYKGEAFISKLLDSLINQSIDPKLFEAIFIVNGEPDSTPDIIKKYQKENPQINIILTYSDPGVCNARNVGIDLSTREYSIFIDDDDYVSPFYLEELYAKASLDTISLCYPYAFNDGTPEIQLPYYITDAYEYCSRQTRCLKLSSKVRKYFSGPCMKLIPMDIIKERRFDVNFRNGEDTLFMFLISDRFRYFAITSPSAVYYRRYRLGSALFNKRSLKERVVNCILHQFYYVRIFISNPFKYNFTFFVSRFLGEFVSIRN